MKKTLLIIVFSIIGLGAFAQGTIELTVRWSTANSRYEVYGKPNFTMNNFTWGNSQISPVVPASAPDASLTITSFAAGTWGDNSKVYAPTADPAHDFHGVTSDGSLTNLTAGQETLLFSFIFLDGLCRDGIRLFVNNADPQSTASGMLNGDFRNAIDNGNLQNVYISNYNNTGTTCSACVITAPELSKQ